MTKNREMWRGLHELYVLLTVCELGRPAKEQEIKKITGFQMTSLSLSYWTKRGCIEHDEINHTWGITDAGRAYLLKIEQQEADAYHDWEQSQK
jgi:hypothetical protein